MEAPGISPAKGSACGAWVWHRGACPARGGAHSRPAAAHDQPELGSLNNPVYLYAKSPLPGGVHRTCPPQPTNMGEPKVSGTRPVLPELWARPGASLSSLRAAVGRERPAVTPGLIPERAKGICAGLGCPGCQFHFHLLPALWFWVN